MLVSRWWIVKKWIIFFFRQSLHDQVETSDERWVHRLQNSDLPDLPPTSDPLVNRSYLLIQFKSTKLLVKGNLVLYSKDYGQQRLEKKLVTVVNLNNKHFLFTQFINLTQKLGMFIVNIESDRMKTHKLLSYYF